MLATLQAEMLERAIGYARGNLATVSDDLMRRPTPCDAWTLGQLLDHMVDSIDAFIEASRGLVEIAPTTARGDTVTVLRTKACALLGAWTSPAAAWVRIGDRALSSRRLLGAASLEVTLHGWDVGQATGRGRAIPEELAGELLVVAETMLTGDNRRPWFGPPLPPDRSSYEGQLLGFTGRRPLPPHSSHPQQGET